MSEEKLNELAYKTVTDYLNKLSGMDSKTEVVKSLLRLLSIIFMLLSRLDGKAVAVKTMLGFLVSITEPSELDKYFNQIEKKGDL